MRVRRLAAIGLLVLACSVRPTTAVLPTTAPDASALIARLDADDWHARDAAAEQLVAIGESVRPAVVDAADHAASPEVRSRAAGVIERLNQVAAERPTLVSLRVTAGDPRDALTALAKQAEMPIRFWPDDGWASRRGPPVTPNLVERPFWPAVLEVCRQAQVGPLGVDKQRVTTFGGRPTATDLLAGPQVLAGPWLLVPKPVVPRGMPPQQAGAQGPEGNPLPLWLFVDPKLRVAGAPTVELTVAQDERGWSLLPEAVSRSRRTLAGRSSARRCR